MDLDQLMSRDGLLKIPDHCSGEMRAELYGPVWCEIKKELPGTACVVFGLGNLLAYHETRVS
jgi:hypothetical protein